MFYSIKKNSVSNFPVPKINCSVLCFLNEEDKQDEKKAVYWISYEILLSECVGLTKKQIDEKIKEAGEILFNDPQMQVIFQAIEVGGDITAPEIIEKNEEVSI